MKKLYYIISAVLFVSIIGAIIIRERKGDYNRVSSGDVFKVSITEDVLISNNEMCKLKAIPLILTFRTKENNGLKNINPNVLNIKPEDLLNKENIKVLKKNKELIIISSKDIALATNTWVVLSQMGYKNVRILGDISEFEFKYSFQPDTNAGYGI